MTASWTLNDELASRSRLASYAPSPRASAAAQLALLIALGALASILTSIAASPIRLPGHAILRGTLPLICGLSLAPRRGAGTIMSLAAMVAFALMMLVGATRVSFAAVAGLAMLGPLLDLVTTRAANLGWQLYVRFAAAGLAANLIAFAVRFATGSTATAAGRAGGGHGAGRGMGLGGGNGMGGGRGAGGQALQLAQEIPWTTMLFSFALFGAVAGLVCGAIWFRSNPRQVRETEPPMNANKRK